MILEYHRPDTLEETLQLLARREPRSVPMGGGTVVSGWREQDFAVVDLQNLPLHDIRREGHTLQMGATTRLSQLAQAEDAPTALRDLLTTSVSSNLRNMSTLGGTIVSTDGRSALITALLAMDAELYWQPTAQRISLGNYLPLRTVYCGQLLTQVLLPLQGVLGVEHVSRTPADWPLLVVAAYRWPAGRVRVAVGGFGSAPVLALDGLGAGGAVSAVRSLCAAASDEWASGEYRAAVAAQLTRSLLARLEEEGKAT